MRNHHTDIERAKHGLPPVNLDPRETLEDAGFPEPLIALVVAQMNIVDSVGLPMMFGASTASFEIRGTRNHHRFTAEKMRRNADGTLSKDDGGEWMIFG